MTPNFFKGKKDMGGVLFAAHRGKNGQYSTLNATVKKGIEKGRLLETVALFEGLKQDNLLFGNQKTVGITALFGLYCIATRTIIIPDSTTESGIFLTFAPKKWEPEL